MVSPARGAGAARRAYRASRPRPHAWRGPHARSRVPARPMAAFTANPLSLSMSNEAVGAFVRETEAVERRQRETDARRGRGARGGRAGDGFDETDRAGSGRRGASSRNPVRYQTPYLTVSDLRKPAKPWREFFASDFLFRSYRFPRSLFEARLRLDGNVFEFFGNYRALGFVFAGCVLWREPRALLGGYALYELWRWVEAHDDARESRGRKVRNVCAGIVSWVVALYAKVSLAVAYAILVTATFVVAHGSTRKRDAPAPDWGRSPRRRDSALGKLRLRE